MKKTLFIFLCGSFLASSAYAQEIRGLSDITGSPDKSTLAQALQKGQDAYDAVRDYRALFIKQELSGDAMGPKEDIFLKFEKPFKIFMKWTNTHKKNLQVLYERGQHDNKLAIHQPGLLLGLAQVIFLDQNSPWVKEGSESYNIEDAGIGTFLMDLTEDVIQANKNNVLEVKEETPDATGRIWDVAFRDSDEKSGYMAKRLQVHFDAATALPDRMKLYDWKNRLMGDYAYENLMLNLGPHDPEFEKQALRKLYRLYQPSEKKAARSNFSGKSPRATPTGD